MFNNFPSFDERFEEHLRLVWAIPKDHRQKLVDGALEMLRAETTGEEKTAREKAIEGIPGDQADLVKAVNVLHFIATEWNPVTDTSEAVLADVRQLGLLPTDQAREIEDFLLRFFSALGEDRSRRLRKIFASSVVPNYLGVTTVVDFRFVFDNPYGSGRHDTIDNYTPTHVGHTPVVLVRLKISGLDPVVFQAEPQDVRLLIQSLQAALKDLDVASKMQGVTQP